MKFKSLKTKLIVIFSACLLFTIGATILYGFFSGKKSMEFVTDSAHRFATDSAEKQILETSRAMAFEIRAELEVALDTARTLAESFIVVKDPSADLNLSRQGINGILRTILKNNKHFVGTYTLWEPNELDNLDSNYINLKGYDDTGRFIPYWSRDENGKIDVAPLVDYRTYEKHDNGVRKGDYYLLPKDRLRECVIDPYPYPIHDDIVWITSLVVPIMTHNKFYGITGVDMRLDFIQSLAENVNKSFYDGSGRVAIVSSNAILAAVSGAADLVGKHLKEIEPDEWQVSLKKIHDGRNEISFSGDHIKVIVPMEIGKTGISWAVIINVPKSIVFARANEMIQGLQKRGQETISWQSGIGMVILLVAFLIIWFTSRQIVSPIARSVDFAKAVAQGDLNASISISSAQKDEIGILVNALDEMKESIKKVLNEMDEMIKAVHEGRLEYRGDAKAYQGGWRELVLGINNVIDAFVSPINMTSECIDKLSKSEVPQKITMEFRGDFNILKENLNMLIDDISSVLKETEELSTAITEGRLKTRGNTEKFGGGWNELVIGINNVIDAFAEPVFMLLKALEQMARGDIPSEIKEDYKGDFNKIKNNFNLLINAMNETSDIAEEIANGNLKVDADERSENDRLMKALNIMIDNLTRFAADVQTAAERVTEDSEQLNSVAAQVAEGSSHQAAGIEQISASMEEMSSSLSASADNTAQTATIAIQTAKAAQNARKAVNETVEALENISKKIRIIEEIARQTNMLALNAAIEAARAGTYGKGFAVVAAEIRKLAERSQKAAKVINTLSASNLRISENTVGLLEEMVDGTQKTSEVVQEINISNNEQADGITEVGNAIQQLESIIQKNAASAEQMATASHAFLSQADWLLKSASFFKIVEKRKKESETKNKLNMKKIHESSRRQIFKDKSNDLISFDKKDEEWDVY